tara:strand:- start:508 stop:978 length:471 start_codon:yes stop_codon:yes gene_type:complete
MFGFLTRRVTLLGILALVCAISFHYYIKANDVHPTVLNARSSFYTPGQHSNCKWVIHFSNKITTMDGDNSPAQIGIPEIIQDGYISGIIQNGPGKSLLLAFKLPTQSDKTPPIVLTATYSLEELPLKQISFRVFNSTVLRMVLYSTYEQCIEATME